MEEILREILIEDKSILARREELINLLDKKITSNLRRDFSTIKKALDLNVGNIFISEEDIEIAGEKAVAVLKKSGMQEARINFVVETFAKALRERKESPKIVAEDFNVVMEYEAAKTANKADETAPASEQSDSADKNIEENVGDIKRHVYKNSASVDDKLEQISKRHEESAQKTGFKKVYFLVAGVILFMALYFVSGNKFAGNEDTSYLNARSELSLNGIDLGTDAEQVEVIFGRPKSRENFGEYQLYIYSDIEVGVKDDAIEAFFTRNPKFKTLRGLKVGASYEDIVKSYGTTSKDIELEELILYEYPFTSIDEREGLLRFAVNKSDRRVNYISVRISE